MAKLTFQLKYHLLKDTLQKVRDTLEINEILEYLLDFIRSIVDYDAAGIFILSQDFSSNEPNISKQAIAGVMLRGFDNSPVDADDMLMKGKGIIGHVIVSGKGVIVPDVRKEDRYVIGRKRTKSEIAVPLIHSRKTFGALNLESDRISAYDTDDLEILEFFANAASIAIDQAMLHKQLLEREILRKQLQMAKDVQSKLFPPEPPIVPGYDIAGICIPAEEIGGDYYDFIKLQQTGLGVIDADVSGKGIPAALIMTAFRAIFRMNAHNRIGIKKIFTSINRQLPEITGNSHFVTAVYLSLDINSDEITYICCGHPPCLLRHANGFDELLNVRGPVLGVFNNVDYPLTRFNLERGDILLSYTDGVVERLDRDGKQYGVEKLKTILKDNQYFSSEEIIQQINKGTQDFSDSVESRDDFTVVVIKKL